MVDPDGKELSGFGQLGDRIYRTKRNLNASDTKREEFRQSDLKTDIFFAKAGVESCADTFGDGFELFTGYTVTGDKGDRRYALAALVIPGVSSGVLKVAKNLPGSMMGLKKSLKSAEQLSEMNLGGGISIAGKGSAKNITDVDRLIATYGGKAEDWSKMSTKNASKFKDGSKVETHWYQNNELEIKVEPKSKITDK